MIKFLKFFWNFSKSKNRKILKFYFDEKNYFPVSLRPNYIDLHSLLTQIWKNNLQFFWTLNFFQKFRKFCEQFLWGSSPQNAHTDEPKFDGFCCPQSWSPLEHRMNWKKIELYNVITKFSARRALPNNDQMYSVNENTQTTKQTELKAPDLGPTPDPGPRLPPRWSLFVHSLSLRAG